VSLHRRADLPQHEGTSHVWDYQVIDRAEPADEIPTQIRVRWADGTSSMIDMSALISRHSVLAPPVDTSRLAQIQVTADGHGLRWADDLTLSAAELLCFGSPEGGGAISAESFRTWRMMLQLSVIETAEVLGIPLEQVEAYEAGTASIPKLVALACIGIGHMLAPDDSALGT
jgi:hypothetical protein